jgi:heat shock protein HslJ
MKHTFPSLTGLVLAALALSLAGACATPKVSSGSAAPGGTWILEQFLSEGSLKAIPAGVRAPELTFADDGRLSGFTGVNRLVSAPWNADPVTQSLTIGPAAITQMAGLSMDAVNTENTFLARLSEVQTYSIEGTKLLLKGDAQEVLLVFIKADL